MFKSMLLFAKIGVLAIAVLLMSAGPSLAQRGHGGHGGGHAGISHVGHARIGGAHYGSAHYGGAHYSRGFIGGRHYAGLGYRNGRGYGGGGWAYPYYYGGYGPDYYGGYWPDYYDSNAPYLYTPNYSVPPYAGPLTPVAPVAPVATVPPYFPAGAAASAYNDNTAGVDVTVPTPDAAVWFNGQKTVQTGTVRHFVTPPLSAGQTHVYEVRATWMVNGQPVTQLQEIQVQAGEETMVRFPR